MWNYGHWPVLTRGDLTTKYLVVPVAKLNIILALYQYALNRCSELVFTREHNLEGKPTVTENRAQRIK